MIKWLYPGMNVKRWLLLLAVGVVTFSLSIAMGLAWLYRNVDMPEPVTDAVQVFTLQFIPHPYREFVAGLPGLFLICYAIYRLSHSILAAVLPVEVGKSRLALVDRIYAHRYGNRGPRIVAVGGGTGLSTMLRGLKKYSRNITAILTVGDDGGSTGRLRRDMGILPPGDFRNCIVALADREPLVAELFQYRFPAGSGPGLEGHSFGNLFIVAMLGVTGDFEKAVAETSRVLAVRGQVLPSTMADVTVCAEMQDGSRIVGESSIAAERKPIRRVFLQPERPKGYPEALRAVLDADLIILGPGSLYTSILPNLLVEELAQAIRLSSALKVYVCNVATQRGETDHFSIEDHVRALADHVGPGFFEVVLANDNFSSIDRIKPEWQVHPVGQGEVGREFYGAEVVRADVVNEANPLRHDPDKLAARLLRLWQDRGSATRGQRPRLAPVPATKPLTVVARAVGGTGAAVVDEPLPSEASAGR